MPNAITLEATLHYTMTKNLQFINNIYNYSSFLFLCRILPSGDKTPTRLYENTEKLMLNTLDKMISDPFNKIQGSEHGKRIISLADWLLKNKSN